MATEIPVLQKSFEAGADLSALQFRFVKLNASGQVVAVAAITDVPVGVLQNAPDAAGETAQVMIMGISKVEAAETLAETSLIGPASDGQAAIVAAGSDTTVHICGRVIGSDDAGDGELATAAVNCANPARGA